MQIIKEHEVKGDVYTGENAREIKHLCAPWTLGAKHVWMGVIDYQPHCTSNMHSHEVQEEVFYCISGKGAIIVDGEQQPLEPGTVVYVPPLKMHQLINNSNQVLKVLSTVSPPFEREQYEKDHKFNEEE
ncbi:cupin domain-containing protein [Bacillus sp. JJ1533]|uniref:cupin domain-containing protein n=1 Tax=Bacillus sp. JJ1533 TaxID=3122959 RepID=UPI003000B21C